MIPDPKPVRPEQLIEVALLEVECRLERRVSLEEIAVLHAAHGVRVVEIDGRVAGHSLVQPGPSGALIVESVCVDPEHRRLGIGGKLVLDLMTTAAATGKALEAEVKEGEHAFGWLVLPFGWRAYQTAGSRVYSWRHAVEVAREGV